MILITQDEEPTGLSSSINAVETQLADMRAEMEEIYERIKRGDLGALKDATRATEEIRKWLKIALEAEVQLEKRKSREGGIARDFAIDFDAARAAAPQPCAPAPFGPARTGPHAGLGQAHAHRW